MKTLNFGKFGRLPWHTKLVVLMFAMAVIPGLIISYSITGLIRNELKSNVDGQIIFSTTSVASNVDSKVRSALESIELIKNVFENPELDSDQKIAFLVSSVEKIDNLLSLSVDVKTKNGYEEVISSRKDFKKTKNNQFIPLSKRLGKVDPGLLLTKNNLSIYFSAPEYDRNIETWISALMMKTKIPHLGEAVIVAQIDFSEISSEVENHYLNKAGYVFVIDESGKKFFNSRLMTNFPEKVVNEAVSLLRSKNRITLVNNYTDPSNKKYVTSFSCTQRINWAVVAALPEEVAYSVVRDAFIFFSIFILISVISSVVIAKMFSKHLSKPIIQMADTSKTIAAGNFEVSFDYLADDSIGQLGNSLTSMGSQLRKNFDEIEKQKDLLEDYAKNLEVKVAQRTNELSESNKELKKAYQRVLELNEDKNEFLGIAAHDLKNPLIAISSFAEILREDKDLTVEEHLDFLMEIEKASKRMFSIVKNLLDVNAIEQGKLNTNMENISLLEVVNELKLQFKEITSKKNITIVEIHPDGECFINADQNLTVQICQNILSNAIKFSPPDKRIFITTKYSDDKNFIEIKFKDEGPGFTENDKKKLFQKFARLSARPTAGEHSTGLGLSIVKKLVEMMGGLIKLESESGKGAEFIISFPIAKDSNEQEA